MPSALLAVAFLLGFFAVSCLSRSLDDESWTSFLGAEVQLAERWPDHVQVGQVGGVDFDGSGNAVVFHRASRKWNDADFEVNGEYNRITDGKIQENTIAIINKRGKLVDSWGSDLFFMPHGLTIDDQENVWLTDVAAHQVFKFDANDKTKPTLVLGEALTPGSDATHFCQPTDVAVASNGDFFVADGYCNSRILKFDSDGRLLAQFGAASSTDGQAEPGTFSLPHSLALIEDTDTLCVADRQNDRIQCFDAGLRHANRTGELKTLLAYRNVEEVYAIAYDKRDMLLHGLSVGEYSFAFTIALTTPGLPIVSTWSPPRGFKMPHDLAVSPDGENMLVGELGRNRLLLFQKSN